MTRLVLTAAGLLLTAAPAHADNPTFTYGKQDDVKDVKKVTWAAVAEAGLVLTTGNSKTTTLTGDVKASRVDPKNKLAFEGDLAYARSTLFIATDDNGNGTIGANEIHQSDAVTTNAWKVQLRYDRFLTDYNSLYATAVASADRPGGKAFVGGAQAGYSRRLYKSDHHEVVAEVGYDYSYLNLVAANAPSVSIHSARVFAGYKGTLSDSTSIDGSVEVLENLNHLKLVPKEANAFQDTRINSSADLTTKITKDISFSFSVGLKFDNRPAPRVIAGAPPFDTGFVPVADKLDTITKASLIVTLL